MDDEKPFVEIISQRLHQRGFNVTGVFSGLDALSQIEKENTIDVVVMDITMPEMDGVMAMQKIKNKHPLIEIIMLTGHASVPSAIESMKLGAFDYAVKPCELDVLIEKINGAATRKKDREKKILEIRMVPYITNREREAMISEILLS